MEYKENILELIGNTPLVKLNKLTKGSKRLVLAKMESLNPGGLRQRPHRHLDDRTQPSAKGGLKPGGTVVEATSGNTGIGIALVCAVRGYKAVFVMTDKCSVEEGSLPESARRGRGRRARGGESPIRRTITSTPPAASRKRRRTRSSFFSMATRPTPKRITSRRGLSCGSRPKGASLISSPASERAARSAARAVT